MLRSRNSLLSSTWSIVCLKSHKRSAGFRLHNQTRAVAGITNSMSEVQESLLPKDASLATVKELYNMSPTVKGLKLLVDSTTFSFHAGQWVDLFIPSEKLIGGFSICSSPRMLKETRHIELAIKLSKFPPVQWIHDKCSLENQVGVRVGGEFYYNPQPNNPLRDILLVAGGVGINPLISIMRHVADLRPEHRKVGQIVLLYSARTADELIFQNDIFSLLRENNNMLAKFFLTRQSKDSVPEHLSGVDTHFQRIDRQVLTSVMQSSFDNLSNVDCYICGPNKMIDAMDEHLINIGLTQTQIRYEKWW